MRKPIALLFAFASACSPAATTSSDLTLTVDGNTRFQRIDGFGGTLTLFEDDGIFKRHDASQPATTSATMAQKRSIAEQLYRQIGLTRTRLFPAAFEPTNDNADPSTLEAGGFTWSRVDPLIEWVALARPSGLTTFFASFGTNGGTASEAWLRRPNDACALDTARLDEYVEWQLAVALHFRDGGAELPYLTINNEPDFCPIGGNPTPYFLDPLHFVEAVKRLGARLEQNGLGAKIVVTDGVTPGSSLPYFRAVLEDPHARPYVGALAFHSYDGYQDPAKLRESAAGTPTGTDARREVRALAEHYGLPLWMTEVCYCTPQSEGGAVLGAFELGRLRLNHLIDELERTGVSAFDVMNAFFIARPGVRDELVEIGFNPDGTLADAAIAPYGRLIGHYAQAAPPGSVRVDARSSDARVRLVAFARPDGKLALVALNNGSTAVRAALAFTGAAPATLRTLVTVEDDAWREGEAVRDAVTLPPRSVTTLTAE